MKRHWSDLAGGRLRDHLVACVGAGLAIAVAGVLGYWAVPDAAGRAALVAPMGASAVLLFAVPASPLAQPWPAIGGNVLSALVGIAVVAVLPPGALAGGVAVCAAIAVMALLRCLHPPGGAMALTVAIMPSPGPGLDFVAAPVAANAAAMVIAAWAFHGITGGRYPHLAPALPARPDADAEAALAAIDTPLDVDRRTLGGVLSRVRRPGR